MSKTYAVTIIETITREATVIVRAPDIHDAKDAAYDFARKEAATMSHRFRVVGNCLEAYNSRALEISGERIIVDVEA